MKVILSNLLKKMESREKALVHLASMAYHLRNSYTVDFKILVVEWNDHNIHKVARQFNIGRKLVREWEK